MTSEWVSFRAFGREMGVSHPAVLDAVKSGRLRLCLGTRRGKPCINNMELARREWNENATRVRVGGESAPVLSGLVEAQRVTVVERGRRLKLENDRRSGELVEVSAAAREGFEAARIIREAVLNLPNRLSAELAGESDPGKVHRLLDAALRDALGAAADKLEESA